MISSEPVDLFQVTEVELTYRNKIAPKNRLIIDSSATAYSILKRCWDHNRVDLVEEFKILLLNRGSACLGIANIAVGGCSALYVDPKFVFATALKANASAIILAHNHPSGNLKPSKADIMVTKQLLDAGKVLHIDVPDHLLITSSGYYSMADNGLMPGGIAPVPVLNMF